MPAISKITAKGQTTVPREVRVALKTNPGDLIAWDVASGGRVTVRRLKPNEVEDLLAIHGTLGEWHTAEAEKARRKV